MVSRTYKFTGKLYIYIYITYTIIYILYVIYILNIYYIYIYQTIYNLVSLLYVCNIWATDTIITVFQICTEILPSAIVLTSPAWSTLIAPRQYFLVQIWIKANIVLISFYYHIRIADPNANLKTTAHYLSLIFTFFEVCITVENTLMNVGNPVDAPTTVSMLIYIHKESQVSILALVQL